MTVKIITDSSASIPAPVVEELGITVIPSLIRFGEEVYRDGIDLTTEQFYERLTTDKTYPTTSVPTPQSFVDAYNKLAEEADEIAVITISHKLSAVGDVALQAIDLIEKKPRIEVIDSTWALMSEGLIVITAARAAKDGAGLDEVMALVRRNIPRTDLRMAFDTLKYLERGGRIGKAQALLGSMLKINPILGLKDGEIYPVGREHSRSKAVENLYNFVNSFSHIEEMAIGDGTTPDEADALVERLNDKFPAERVFRFKVTAAVGAHVGPHVLAVAILGDK
ncbi:MAG TPA: DegV family protein [Dehalococcoidales bacterium]|nr:DegV family protein [Dehalococcoidales bacterium]